MKTSTTTRIDPAKGDEVRWNKELYTVLNIEDKKQTAHIGDVDRYGVVWYDIKVPTREIEIIKRK